MAKEGPLCPIASFEKYISHLNPLNEKRNVLQDETCYDNMVLGKHTLGKKMKDIARDASLSEIYTNHSIRATAVTILDRSGFEARHVMALSGHRGETSIKHYCKTDENTKPRYLDVNDVR